MSELAQATINAYKDRKDRAVGFAAGSGMFTLFALFYTGYGWLMPRTHTAGSNDVTFTLWCAIIGGITCVVAIAVSAAADRAMKRAITEQEAKAHLTYSWQ